MNSPPQATPGFLQQNFSWIESFAVQIVSMVLHSAIHNPATAARLKTVLLRIRDDITALYPGG
jgi:hypothetical protein